MTNAGDPNQHGAIPPPAYEPPQAPAQHPGHAAPPPLAAHPQPGYGQPAYGQAPPAWAAANPALHAFIGNNTERYQRVFHKMEASQSALSWNWPAFLVNFIWLAHRKLYVPAAIAAALVLASILAGGAFKYQPGLVYLFGLGIPGLVALAVGMFGDGLLKKRADSVILQMQHHYPDPAVHLPAIAAVGRTSTPATIGVTIAWFALLTGLHAAGLTPYQKQPTYYYYRY